MNANNLPHATIDKNGDRQTQMKWCDGMTTFDYAFVVCTNVYSDKYLKKFKTERQTQRSALEVGRLTMRLIWLRCCCCCCYAMGLTIAILCVERIYGNLGT